MCTNDGVAATFKATMVECDKLIDGVVNVPAKNPYGLKCPNGKAISHYVKYKCHGVEAVKCEAECSDGNLNAD